MTIYERLKADQLPLRKQYAKTKNVMFKDQATVLNLVVSRLAPSGNEELVVDDSKACNVIREFINSNLEVMKNLAARERDKAKAENENQVLQDYLPSQLEDEDIERIVTEYITQNDISGRQHTKQVMNFLKENYEGSYDSKNAGGIVNKLL